MSGGNLPKWQEKRKTQQSLQFRPLNMVNLNVAAVQQTAQTIVVKTRNKLSYSKISQKPVFFSFICWFLALIIIISFISSGIFDSPNQQNTQFLSFF